MYVVDSLLYACSKMLRFTVGQLKKDILDQPWVAENLQFAELLPQIHGF